MMFYPNISTSIFDMIKEANHLNGDRLYSTNEQNDKFLNFYTGDIDGYRYKIYYPNLDSPNTPIEKHQETLSLAISEPKKFRTLPIVNRDKKFIIGGTYYIYPFRNKRLKRFYTLKKFIYTINDELVRVVIMKQIKGNEPSSRYTLNRTDCKHFHIKYESGLEVFSMDLDWKLLKQ